MSEKDVIIFPISNTVTVTPKKPTTVVGEGYKIQPSSQRDLEQYITTIRAFDETKDPKMTLDKIGDAAEYRNELVGRVEGDAPVQEAWQDARVRIVDYGDRIVAMKRGGKLELMKQLSSSTYSPRFSDLTPAPNSPVVPEVIQPQTADVVHGLEISMGNSQQLSAPQNQVDSLDAQRANNTFLKAPADFKEAA